jgi:hypothetical protein
MDAEVGGAPRGQQSGSRQSRTQGTDRVTSTVTSADRGRRSGVKPASAVAGLVISGHLLLNSGTARPSFFVYVHHIVGRGSACCDQPSPACRMATPWRGGQTSVSRVRLTVSPENFPVTLYARASLDPAKPPRVVPENLPSGSSARFSIGTLARASATVPDKRPCLLVRRTSRSPQCPVPGIARPCTIQIPSASFAGAVVAVSKAPTGKTPANEAHTATTRKYNNPGNTVRPLRSITRPPYLEAPPRLEDEAGDPF